MGINSFPPTGGAGNYEFPSELIDPVSKFRISQPENLIDTDFEYGLQPTKWETVELINNTPSFFSKSGDTTIDGISSIITNAGTREIIVKTELDHGLAVGIPINVTGTKSITADGSYIINSIPDTKTFTYLCKDDQEETASILDLYSSIITGEFFQGSQLRVSDSEGIITDAEGTSQLTVTTNSTHGFGENTPFYFLNLNSTVAQEFQAANTASKTFDASNSATAQTFDGSNTLSSFNIDWSNSAVEGGIVSNITSTDTANSRITVSHTTENFANLPLGTPLYYSISAVSGYFNTNPRGVVFLKTTTNLGTSTSTFQVSLVPDGSPILFTTALTGTVQVANQAKTFAGNNINPLTQNVIDVEIGSNFNFDGGNQGYLGAVQGTPPNNTLTISSYSGTTVNATGATTADYYVGAMVRYASSNEIPGQASGLVHNATYFVRTFTNSGGGNYVLTLSELPGQQAITISGGTGTQTLSRIGISVDKNVIHIPNSNFAEGDMLQYSFPTGGRFSAETLAETKLFYFVDIAYDTHNYLVSEDTGFKPIVATGGTILPEYTDQGRTWKAHQFSTAGTSNFIVTNPGKETVLEYIIVAGGGGGGGTYAGGGGGGGVIVGEQVVSSQTYPIVVGVGGTAGQGNIRGGSGGNSTAFGQTAVGGGGGGQWNSGPGPNNGLNGGSGGGGGGVDGSGTFGNGGTGTTNQGFSGGAGIGSINGTGGGGGGGGAGGQGTQPVGNNVGGNGGPGIVSSISGIPITYGSGGGGGSGNPSSSYSLPGENGGRGGFSNLNADPGVANTGGGGGGAGGIGNGYIGSGQPGVGGSGTVIVRYPITPPVPFSPASATGGSVTEVLDSGIIYRVHTFTSVGGSNFVVSDTGSWNSFDTLIVGGGAGGAKNYAGGGGAGGVVFRRSVPLSAQAYSVVVGAGGLGSTTTAVVPGQSGGNSSAFGLVALGGGGGMVSLPGIAGGSGGGGSYTSTPGGLGQQPTSASGGFGNSGGQGGGSVGAANSRDYWGGGGGGAGTAGLSGPAAGIGGDGRAFSINGFKTIYATGGGGGQYNQTGAKIFNTGGSSNIYGNTGGYGSEQGGDANTPNRGSGGGGVGGVGAGQDGTGRAGNGSSGIVIVRYPIAVQSPGEFIVASNRSNTAVPIIQDAGVKYALYSYEDVGGATLNVFSTASVTQNNQIEYLVVGGGGSGGGTSGITWFAPGGGGNALSGSVTATVGTFPIIVGDAGQESARQSGRPSSALGITANPGTAGDLAATGYRGGNSGSGLLGGTLNGNSSGGGAGAAQAGQNAPSGSTPGNGGNGITSNITGTSRSFGGGGGGLIGGTGGQQGLGGPNSPLNRGAGQGNAGSGQVWPPRPGVVYLRYRVG